MAECQLSSVTAVRGKGYVPQHSETYDKLDQYVRHFVLFVESSVCVDDPAF